ncbi:MAG: hypothetical protein JWL92_99 [Candidatus Nomurabacteria bacterium]|nr:hypothetical protein [Candidatus Nomurabacteria bacterium]
MNKILKIILILIGAFFLILGIIWLIGRNSALKNGKEPLTFRQFLGLSTKKAPVETVPGEGSSSFNGGGTTTGGSTNGGDGTAGTGTNGGGSNAGAGGISVDGNGNVAVSQFTNGATGLGTNGIGGSGISNGTGTSGGLNSAGNPNASTGTIGNGNSINISGIGNSSSTSQPVCSDEDLNIDFTPAQLAQLNILQSRFYALAQTLHSDADVETEVANHDAFTLKADSVLELYSYCESKLPYINAAADSRLRVHVATPFWTAYDSNPAVPSYVNAKTGLNFLTASDPAKAGFSILTYAQGNKTKYGLLDLTQRQFIEVNGSALQDWPILTPAVENILRINLW